VTPPWLEPAVAALTAAQAGDRMPHGLLIHESPGAGGDWLADWVARLLLCRRPVPQPCGECEACRRAAAGQHPDLISVRPAEDSQQLKIEQVRELAQELALTAHQGGYKVGVLSPADALNRFAANALLKTLEEPPPRTVLILVACEPSRLPATILSRCQRVRLPAPARAASTVWLTETCGPGNWDAVLDVLGEAPLLAAQADARTIPQLGNETRRTLEEVAAGTADPAAIAERWHRSDLALRLRCFENWLTERIRSHFAPPGGTVEFRAPAHLPQGAPTLKLRGHFELMDGVRDLKSALDTPLNKALALEGLLRRLAPAERR
jgi:DNA polymerase-3 subunit delta'